jgi:integrase
MDRLAKGHFLTPPELDRLASAAQYRAEDLADAEDSSRPNVISMARIRLRQKGGERQATSVDVATCASRLRYIAEYLEFVSDYVGAGLPAPQRRELELESARALKAFREHVPPVSKRAKLGARVGLSEEEQKRLLDVVRPGSPANPWDRDYVQLRNWLMVVLLLATGMRRGELLGLQIGDLNATQPKLRILRRADAVEDTRLAQPGTKTHDREVELKSNIMKVLWDYINKDRHQIKAARAFPQVFVADDGKPLSLASVDKLFMQLRVACPGLPVRLTSHVMRHTWNERFSEQAEALGLSESDETRARNSQQGWSDNSKMATNYTRRHNERKGREVSLKLQENLDAQLKSNK